MRAKRAARAAWVVVLAAVASLRAPDVQAQAPTIPATHAMGDPGSYRSTLGPIPGAGGNPFGMTPGTDPAFLGGRPGPSVPHVPSVVTAPSGVALPVARGITAPRRVPITNVPLYGPLEVPAASEEEGPPDGLSLDAAIDRLLRNNLSLLALQWQIPAARADVLTASLRANPILFADGQLVPYGRYNKDHPGGPPQYDLHVSHPIDYSLKRRARTAVAEQVASVVEAQFQDAVRVQVDNLYTVFVDVLAARETLRYARASEVGLRRLLEINRELKRTSSVTSVDVGRAAAMFAASTVGIADAEAMLRRTTQALGALLNLPAAEAAALPVRGRLADLAPPPPPDDELVRIALASRPDLVAQRLGTRRAEVGVQLARANRFADAYVLYQPYTFQDLSASGLKSATSYALGLTVPVPLYNRNQGGVARSRLNVEQTRLELAALERKIDAEVRTARGLYATTRAVLLNMEQDLVPTAKRMRDDTLVLFVNGELTALDASHAQRAYNEAVRLYRDTLIRHRRSMLSLNTAVGQRILP
jgi:cobalt-zinc-cadmium efflux system outer membrane protein